MKVDQRWISVRIKRNAPLLISLGVALVFALGTIVIESDFFETGLLSKKGLIHLLDLKSLDIKFQSRQMRKLPEPKVVVAAIDEKGMERYGLWPWSRGVLAQFVRKATEGGAKVIAFDGVFGDEDRNSSWVSLRRFAEEYDASGLAPSSELGSELGAAVKSAAEAHEKARGDLATLEQRSRGSSRAQVAAARKEVERTRAELERVEKALGELQQRSTKFSEMVHAEVSAESPDDAFAAALAASPQTVLGFVGFMNESEISGVSAQRAKGSAGLLGASAIDSIYDYIVEDVGGHPTERTQPVAGLDISSLQIRSLVGVLPPIDKLAKAASGFGAFNASPDPDGQMRRMWLLFRYGNRLYPALSLAAAAKYFDSLILPLKNPIYGHKLYGVGPLDSEGPPVPADFHGRLLLNYYTDPERYFPTYSVADIVDGTVPASAYAGKVVLFGMTAHGWFDLKPTPFSPATPGVYIQATAIQNMIDGLYLDRFFGIALVEALAYLLLGLLLGLVLPRVPAWAGSLVTIGVVALLYFVDLKLIFPRGVWVMNVLPTMQAFVTFLGISVHGFLTEGKEKRMIRKAFQFYLSKSVVDEVLKDPAKLKLGGERVNATVMFSDVRGFTSISEKLTPEALVSLLNSYLTPMTDIVLAHEGTLDKYIGDAIMAVFGAPVPYPDHATRACKVALAMMSKLAELRVGWREQGLPDIDIGIGLNTGHVSAGNMGSMQRFDYTVMGDNVNLASRLEGINKQYGTNVIISESTFEAAKQDVYAREIDLVRVKGKREPVKIYELLGLGTPTPQHADLMGEFQRALELYRAQRWDEAVAAFERVRTQVAPGDAAAAMYLERCDKMRHAPPGDGWDGVYVMTTK